jgi:acetyl-CoA synthetase
MAPEMAPPRETSDPNLTTSLRENRVFPPPAAFAATAHIASRAQYDALYRRSIDEPEVFWAGIARELHWFRQPTQTLTGEGHPQHERQLPRPPRRRRPWR